MEVNEEKCKELLEKHKEDLEKFKNWIVNESNLPKNIKPIFLLRFLKVYNFDHKQARELIQINFEFRAKYPQIFTNRNIDSDEIQKAIQNLQIFPLSKPTRENYGVLMGRWTDDDASGYDVLNATKWLFFMVDVILNESFHIYDAEIAVVDFKNFKLAHFFKVAKNLTVTRAFFKFIQDAVPYRIVQNHYINCSPIVSKLMNLLKPFIKSELFDTMHFHTSGYESLHKFIPKEILPIEYGGTCGTIEELHNRSIENTRKYCSFVMDDNNFKLSE